MNKPRLVVIGNGMAAARVLEDLRDLRGGRDAESELIPTVLRLRSSNAQASASDVMEDAMRYVLIGLFVALAPLSAPYAQSQVESDEAAVIRTDREWQQAKLAADVTALDRIMADAFYEMNQNGNGRNKSETLALWSDFRIAAHTTDSLQVRFSGNAASVTGTQTEVNGTGVDRMVFTRVYVRDGRNWRLLSSMQSRNPHLT